MRFVFGIIAVGSVFLLAGCNSEVARVTLKGKVTLDGKQIDSGLVEFIPTDGNSPSAKGGIIVDGIYTAEVVPGDVTVKITSSKVVGKKKMYDTPDSPTTVDTVEQIPKKYNAETILKKKVQLNQKELDFELLTK